MGLPTRELGGAPGLRRSPVTKLRLALWARWGWLWRPFLFTSVMIAFLLGRAVPGLPGAPLGIAFFTATRAAGAQAGVAIPVGAATVLGAWSAGTGDPLGAVLGLIAASLLLTFFRAGSKAPAPLVAALVGGASALVPGFLLLVSGGFDQLAVARLLFYSGLTAVVSLIFCQGVAEVISGRAFHYLRAETPFATIALAGAALTGVIDMPTILHYFSPWQVSASLVVLISAYAGGWTSGAAAGGVIGLAFLVAKIGIVGRGLTPAVNPLQLASLQTMGYLLAGMLAGCFRELRWGGVVVAFTSAIAIFSAIAMQGTVELTTLLASVGAAAFILLLLPRRFLTNVPVAFLSAGSSDHSQSTNSVLLPSARAAERIRGLSRVLREVRRAFDQVAAIKQAEPEAEPVQTVIDRAADRLCQSCSLHGQCWKNERDRTYGVLANLWSSVQREGPLSTRHMPEELEQICIYPKEMVHTLNYLYDLRRTHQYWERRFDEGRGVVGEHLRNITQILDKLGEEVSGRVRGGGPVEAPVIRLRSGVAKLPRKGNHVSGDSYAGEQAGDERYLLALSDGMGVGPKAALESRQSIGLLRQLIGAGFSTEVAVQTVNSVLLLRSPEDSFATIDLTLIGLTDGRSEFVKVGAPPSFLVRGEDVTVIRSEGVPVGIINRVQVEPEVRLLRPGDMIVMVTDGLWDVSRNETDKERWLIEHLQRTRLLDPEELAESIIARGLELTDRNAADDMTVLAAIVESASEESPLVPARFKSAPVQWAIAKLAPRRRTERKE